MGLGQGEGTLGASTASELAPASESRGPSASGVGPGRTGGAPYRLSRSAGADPSRHPSRAPTVALAPRAGPGRALSAASGPAVPLEMARGQAAARCDPGAGGCATPSWADRGPSSRRRRRRRRHPAPLPWAAGPGPWPWRRHLCSPPSPPAPAPAPAPLRLPPLSSSRGVCAFLLRCLTLLLCCRPRLFLAGRAPSPRALLC